MKHSYNMDCQNTTLINEEGEVECLPYSVRGLKSSAIVVERAVKSFGKGKKKVFALQELQMRVPHESIYGLLGPSGCGKTTLLGCIVNRLKLDGGRILIFGFPPGSFESAVPGGRVGYMPQELALYRDLTISETLQYFGRLHQLFPLNTKERSNFLISFLDLPDTDRLIEQLSGGQQRRVSLAAALLHEPDLLILDEPTVGVDPLLRTSIWNHMLEVSKTKKTTIVITTHYIEEARQAHKVGLMRQGRLLAEASPQSLMNWFGFSSLEKVFLKLCVDDGDLERSQQTTSKESRPEGEKKTSIPEVQRQATHILRDDTNQDVYVQPWVSLSKTEKYFSLSRMKSLMIKNLIRLKRNVGFLFFAFIIPPFQMVLFCVTVGGTPHDLSMAVVDLDDPLIVPDVSDIFLQNLNNLSVKQIPYDNFELGYSSVVEGKTWGLVFMNSSFSFLFVTEQDSAVQVYLDETNEVISLTLKIQLYRAMEETISYIISSGMGMNFSDYTIPIQMEEPVYGVDESSFRNFVAPGILITTTFFMAVALTALSFIVEKREGLLDRAWVSGVKTPEVVFSHLCTQMLVMIVQITLVMTFMFPIFNIPCEGNILWVILLTVLQGISGMCYGMMVSGFSKDEMTAIQIIQGTIYPVLLVSGVMWPVEGMPDFMRYISYVLPQTYACESIRAILYRGWNITYFAVYIGYIVTAIWTVFFVLVTSLAIKL